MPRNLAGIPFPERKAIIEEIKTLQSAAKNAYDLSMLLLVAAILGEQELYTQIRKQMLPALQEKQLPSWVTAETTNAVMAWLYGRVSVAAERIGKTGDAAKTSGQALSYVQKSEPNVYLAWASCYILIGSQRPDLFKLGLLKYDWIDLAHEVTDAYKLALIKIPLSGDIPEDLLNAEKSARTNALWTWIMVAQTAAQYADKENYQAAWMQIKDIVLLWHYRVKRNELNTGHDQEIDLLFDAFPADDYRAWGLATLLEAESQMPVFGVTDLLKTKTIQAIEHPEITTQDKLLATVIYLFVQPPLTVNHGQERWTSYFFGQGKEDLESGAGTKNKMENK